MLTPFEHLRGCTLAASDGEIGTVREFYFSDENWRVRYLVVDTGTWLGGRTVLLIPDVLRDVDAQADTIGVSLTREQVRNSPPTESDRPVSRQREEELHQHYRWNPYWIVPGAAGFGALVPGALLGAQTGMATTNPPPEAKETLPEQHDPHLRSSAEIANRYAIHAQDGEIGRVYDFVLDDRAWRVSYLVARTGVWFGKDVLIAPDWIERISFERSEIFVNLSRSAIKDAPAYDAGSPISDAYQQRLRDHYGRKEYWDAVSANS